MTEKNSTASTASWENSRLVPLLPFGRVDNVLSRARTGLGADPLSPEGLREQLESAQKKNVDVVFPSHFFEYHLARLALSLAESYGVKVFLQLSPGAEFAEFFDFFTSFVPANVGLEIVFDRPLADADLNRIELCRERGRCVRLVFCPTRNFDGEVVLRSLPPQLSERLALYFPPKNESQDEFLTNDEIFVLLDRISQSGIEKPFATYLGECEHSHERAGDKAYRLRPTLSSFPSGEGRAFFVLLLVTLSLPWRFVRRVFAFGQANKWRLQQPKHLWRAHAWRLTQPKHLWRAHAWRLAQPANLWRAHAWRLAQPAHLWHAHAWRLAQPKYLWRAHAWRLAQPKYLWRAHAWRLAQPLHYCRAHAWRLMLPVYWVKALAIRTFYLAKSLGRQFVDGISRAYWNIYPLISAPVWTLKCHFPVLYWVLIFPFQKFYWFSEYQVERRLLPLVSRAK